jgi:hypothetical protein
MPKLDKSLYTKAELQKLLRERRKQKELELINSNTQTLARQHNNQMLTHNYGFVVGNGTSRQTIDLTQLKEQGKIYGCNALYREFEPDFLVAVDVKMINEIQQTGWQLEHSVWTNPNKAYRQYTGFNYFQPSKGWSSGPTALWLATQQLPTHDKIFILGFDYAGLENGKLVNNIYAGTNNYKKTTETATYYGNWLKQTCQVIKENKKIQFYRVIQPDNIIPNELNKLSNLKHIFIDEFKKMLQIS